MPTGRSQCARFLSALLLISLFPLVMFAQAAPSVSDTPHEIKAKPNYDAFAEQPQRRMSQAAVNKLQKPGTHIQTDERLGVPTFYWAGQEAAPALSSKVKGQGRVEASARAHLRSHASMYRMQDSDADNAVLESVHNTGRGPIIASFRQSIGGIEIFRERAKVVMDQQMRLVALSGRLTGSGDAAVNGTFALSANEALALAVKDALDLDVNTAQFVNSGSAGGYAQYEFAPTSGDLGQKFRTVDSPRVKPVYYRLPGGLVPAYYVEVNLLPAGQQDSLAYGYVFSATSGKLLMRVNQTAYDAVPGGTVYGYRVWADTAYPYQPFDGPNGNSINPGPSAPFAPTDPLPGFVPQNLVVLQNGPISTNDPWLPAGATVTTGNNVEAFADVVSPDNFQTGDIRSSTTSTNVFDHFFDTGLVPNVNNEQIQGAVTQLFYMNNWLHDWYYDAGFKEADGNAQTNNFGRGGLGNDSIRAQGQDFAGTNNANMSTPADGGRPRMRMYIFSGPSQAAIVASGDLSTSFTGGSVGNAAFGPTSFDITAPLGRLVTTTNSATDGCAGPFNDLSGKIALVDRGTCNFDLKAFNAQSAGAVGVIIANVASSANPEVAPGMAAGTPPQAGITVGTLSLGFSNGNVFRTALSNGQSITIHLFRSTGINRDGTIDNQVIAHEWGHYISNRLIGNAAGLGTNMSGGLGEGWGDFHAMLLTVRATDYLNPTNSTWNGTYNMAGYATGNYYFGIRRTPYSTDMTKDPLTFKHISDANPLPTGIPLLLNSGANSEVHNTGEVWTTMLWECYAALLRDTLGPNPRLTFAEAQDRMKKYIVAAYKITPVNPTLLEARDALLSAAIATDGTDFARFWTAFAKRGAGINAVAPDRFSATNTPVIESYEVGGALSYTATSDGDSVLSCNPNGVLENGERGRISFSVKNSGSVALSSMTGTVNTSNPNVVFPEGNTLHFGSAAPFNSTTGSLLIGMTGATGVQEVTFNLSVDDPSLNPAGPITKDLVVRANATTALDASASDDVEAPGSAWTPVVVSGIGTFTRNIISTGPINTVWNGPDGGLSTGERTLVSPPLSVGPGTLTVSFTHRYSFEFSGTTFFDGGVIEVSTDNGATWTGVATAAAGYNHTLVNSGTNPLHGRAAYSGTSTGYPAFFTQTVNLGTTYANQTIRFRFRVGEDENSGAPGWDIDNIVFTGLTNTPFTQLAPSTGCYSLTVTPSPTVSAGTVTPTSGFFKGGTVVPVSAAANTGWNFANWSGPVADANAASTTVTMNSDVDLTANFTAKVVAGKPALTTTATLQKLSDGSYRATVKIANSGPGTAINVSLLTGVLGAVNGASLPRVLGNIPPGGSFITVVDFPATAGSSGSPVAERYTGSYQGGTFTGSIRAVLP